MGGKLLVLKVGDKCLVEHQGTKHPGIVDHIYKNGTYRISLEDGTANLRNIQPWKLFGPNGEKTYEDESSSEEEEDDQSDDGDAEEQVVVVKEPKRVQQSSKRKAKSKTKPKQTKPTKKLKESTTSAVSSCAVCLESTSEKSNRLLCCKYCKLRIHKHCFFGSGKGPSRASSWACEVCLYRNPDIGLNGGGSTKRSTHDEDDVNCELCPHSNNHAMKITTAGEWVHITCALWVPGMSFGDPENLDDITGIETLALTNGSKPCKLCKKTQRRGKGVRCMYSRCTRHFHATCGLHSDDVFMTVIDEEQLAEYPPIVSRFAHVEHGEAMIGLCPEHSKEVLQGISGETQDGEEDRLTKRKKDLSHIPLPPALFSSDEEFDDHEADENRLNNLSTRKSRRDFLKSSIGQVISKQQPGSKKNAADDASEGSEDYSDSDSETGEQNKQRGKGDAWAVRGADGKLFGGAAGYFRVRLAKVAPAEDNKARKRLKKSLPNSDSLVRIIQYLEPKHPDHLDKLHQAHRSQFSNWWWQMMNDFSVLLFGFGSKYSILQEFLESIQLLHEELLPHRLVLGGVDRFETVAKGSSSSARAKTARRGTDAASNIVSPCVIVLHGYNPATSIQHVVSDITEQWLGVSDSVRFPSLDSQCEFIVEVSKYDMENPDGVLDASQYLRKSSKRNWERGISSVAKGPFRTQDLVLVIHNIDGVALRTAECQNALSILSKSPRVRVIATVDHVHTPLLWNQQHLERFNWVWYDATSYRTYQRETKFVAPVVSGTSQDRSRGTKYVLQSLTRNHVEVLALLARHQLSSQSRQGSRVPGMEFGEFYGALRDDMVVSNDRVLRQLLVELKDHELVAVRQFEGKEYVYICQSETATKEILSYADQYQNRR